MLKISVVTASYNQRDFIEECLASVKDQGYPAVEHIVVDGASTDGTVDLLRDRSASPGWAHLRWVSEPDNGQSDALNKGFRMATGDIVGWLNSDDRYRPGCFQTVARAFEKYRSDIIYGDTTWVDQNGQVWKVRHGPPYSHFFVLYHRVLSIPTTSTFFRRRVFDDGNFLDPTFDFAMDNEFFARLGAEGYTFKHIPGLLADFRWHPQSKSSKAVEGQFRERDRAAGMHSRVLQSIPEGRPRRAALLALRVAAGALLYGEKLLLGAYFKNLKAR